VISGHSGLWTNETGEADRVSVKTTFISFFVILVCLLVGLVVATNLVIRNQREIVKPLNGVLPLLETGTARELQTLQQKGRFYTQTTLLLAGLTAIFTIGGFFLLRGVSRRESRESAARMRGIEETAWDAIITMDHTGLIQSFNPAAEVMLDYAAADVLGKNITMLIPSYSRDMHANSRTTGGRKVVGGKVKLKGQRRDGATFPIELSISGTQQGKQRICTAILRDLSAKQALEEQLQTLVQQLTSASTQLEPIMTAQATSTHQVGTAAQEIAATSQELVQTMHDVARLSADSATAAESSQTSLAHMETTLQALEKATRLIADRLGLINERAANITSVVSTISRVAAQTNLLSLNAAIEAEKAGEHGLGFAVVAREIRRLADQTAEATLDIEHIVKEMTSAVSAGVVGIDHFAHDVRQGAEEIRTVGTHLAQIIAQVQTLTPQFDTVHAGMQAQAQGAQQISVAMDQLQEVAQQAATSLHASSRAIVQLSELAQNLRDG
jgi:PAS domain S-box-containing protein